MTEAGRRARVLYIDDDPGIARLVQRHLDRAGYEVVVCTDPMLGERTAAAGGFDCIAVDQYMPGRDGLDLLAALRRAPGEPPVIFVTGAEEPRIAVAALKNGAADYVIKDVQGTFIELLATSIGQEITRARLEREHEAAAHEIRESRDRLERLAAQQKVLLREVNHRVANSLQLIAALIQMQARRIPDGAARELLQDAVKRVEAVTLVHRRLYTGEDVEFVEMDEYLDGLVDELARTLRDAEPRLRLEIEAEPVRVETDKAVPLGLIVNELVTNAIKYAYPAGESGTIRVRLTRTAPAALRLVVEDDGVGYPPEGVSALGSGLGSVIVNAMAQSLRAALTLDRTHRGTRFVIDLAT